MRTRRIVRQLCALQLAQLLLPVEQVVLRRELAQPFWVLAADRYVRVRRTQRRGAEHTRRPPSPPLPPP